MAKKVSFGRGGILACVFPVWVMRFWVLHQHKAIGYELALTYCTPFPDCTPLPVGGGRRPPSDNPTPIHTPKSDDPGMHGVSGGSSFSLAHEFRDQSSSLSPEDGLVGFLGYISSRSNSSRCPNKPETVGKRGSLSFLRNGLHLNHHDPLGPD